MASKTGQSQLSFFDSLRAKSVDLGLGQLGGPDLAIFPSIYSCKTDSQFPGQIFLAQVELFAYFLYQGGVIVCFCNHRPFLRSCIKSSIADVISSAKNRQQKYSKADPLTPALSRRGERVRMGSFEKYLVGEGRETVQ